eukprot:TRINITY_DN20654_c0_g1_i1.p1 TRINITY_DN20654_c0_g1~~TRINITY_DN20654_c0_g1_i1.p1  ORF type:complete len:1946 (+),score=704.40 TRINITY_DN20654_c0_g1_i1:91-5838(+)
MVAAPPDEVEEAGDIGFAIEQLHHTVSELQGLKQEAPERTLMQRRKQRHDAAVADFEARARELNIELENAVERACVDLKVTLRQGYMQSAAALRNGIAEAGRLAEERLSAPETTPEEARQLQERSLLVDGDDPDGLLRMRRRRVLFVKHQLLELRAQLAEMSAARLRQIASFAATVGAVDARRRDALSRYLRELLDRLREVSWDGQEGIAALAQLKGTEINLSIAVNRRTVISLVGRLLRREAETQRTVEQEFAEGWKGSLEAMCKAATEWTVQRVASDAFRTPPSRRELVAALVSELAGAPLRDRLLAPAQGVAASRRVQEGLRSTALRLAPSGEPVTHPAPQGTLCTARTSRISTAWRSGVVVSRDPAEGTYELDLVGAASEQWPQVDPQLMQTLSAQVGRWEGAPLGGLLAVLHRHLAALARMALSLTQPARSPVPDPMPGGAAAGGWLDGWLPPAPPTAEQLQLGGSAGTIATSPPAPRCSGGASEQVDEWRRALRLLGTRLRALHAEYAARAQQQEEELQEDAQREAWLLHVDIALIFHDSPEPPCSHNPAGRAASDEGGEDAVLCAIRDLSSAGGSEADGERAAELLCALIEQAEGLQREAAALAGQLPAQLPLPPDSMPTPSACESVPDTAAVPPPSAPGGYAAQLQAASRVAAERLHPHLEQLQQESRVFLDVLGRLTGEQMAQLFDECLCQPSSLVPCFRGAAMFLEETSSRFATLTWRHRAELLECRLTFEDADRRREQRFSELVCAVLHGATRAEVDDCFAQALGTLKAIEASYQETFAQREALLSGYLRDLKAATAELKGSLLSSLRLETERDYQARKEAESAPPPPATEDAGKKGAKGKPPAGQPPPEEPPPAPAGLPPPRRVQGPWCELRETAKAAEMLFGEMDEQMDPPPAVLRSEPEESAADDDGPPRIDQTPPEGSKKPSGKKGKEAPPSEDEQREAQRRAEQQRRAEERRKQQKVLRKRLEGQLVPYLPRDMMVPSSGGDGGFGVREILLTALRHQMLQWLDSFAAATLESAERHCKSEMGRLHAWRSDKLRLHQRRAPNLESGEYNGRVRQLVETMEVRVREFAAIEQRFQQSIASVLSESAAWQSAFEHGLAALQERRAALPTAPTLAALAVQERGARAQHEQVGLDSAKGEQRVLQLFDQAEAALRREAQRFLKDSAKGFSEGGTMCDEELASAREAVLAIEQRVQDAVAQHRLKAQEQEKAHVDALAAELQRYQHALADSRDDLDFLRLIGERVSAAKQTLMGHVAKSTVREREIDEAIDKLEAQLRRITHRASGANYLSFMAADPDIGVAKSAGTADFGEYRSRGKHLEPMSLPEDEGLEPPVRQMSAVLRTVSAKLLRQAKLKREAELQASVAQHIIESTDDLRRALYSRGLFLAALRSALPFREVGYLSPKQYIEPRAGGMDDPAPEAVGGRPPSGGKPAPKGAKGAPPPEPAAAAEQAPAGGWDDFLKVEPWTREAARATAACKQQCESVITEYYQRKGDRAVTRPEQITATADQFRQWLARRLDEHEAALRDHVDGVLDAYKRQVTRVFLAAQRMPQEVFNQLYNLCFDELAGSAAACKAMFETLYADSMRLKRLHGEKVKCSMTNPASRAEMAKTEAAEDARHKYCELLLRTFQKLLLREECEEGRRFRARCVQTTGTLFKIFKTLVTPDIVASRGDVIVGRHRSLKRLRKAQLRDQGQPDAQGDAPKGKAKGKDEGKPAPKPAGKQGGKGKGDGKEDDAEGLQLLEKPTQMYPGLPSEGFRTFDRLDRAQPDVPLQPSKPQKAEPEVPEPVTAPGKGKPAAKKAPPAPKDAPKKPPTAPVAAGAAPEEEDEDAVSDGIEGWRDNVFKTTVYHRGQCFEAFRGFHKREVTQLTGLFDRLLQKEASWFSSWNKLVDNLHPERQLASEG